MPYKETPGMGSAGGGGGGTGGPDFGVFFLLQDVLLYARARVQRFFLRKNGPLFHRYFPDLEITLVRGQQVVVGKWSFLVFQKCIFIESFGKFCVFKNGQNGVKIRGFGDGPKMGPKMDTI